MTATGQAEPEMIAGGGPERPSRRWPIALVALVAVIAAAAGVAVQRHATAARDNRLDAPTLRHLRQIVVQGGADFSAGHLVLGVYNRDDVGLPRVRILRLGLAAGALGPVHAIVINHFIGTGEGPLIDDVPAFRVDEDELQIQLTLGHPATCGHPIPGDPPLMMDVALPSGRVEHLRLRIDGAHDPFRSWRITDPHIPWPRVLSEIACRRG